MAIKFKNGIDLEQTEILNALFHPIVGDPASPVEGQVWYNKTLEALRFRDSTQNITVASGAGIGSLVEDTSPQLGGMLDVNGNSIGDGARELLTFVEDPAAVNQLEVENEATGAGPILRATGDDPNVDLRFATKGSGVFNFEGDITITGLVDGRDVSVDGAKLDGITGTNTGDEVPATEGVAGVAEIATQPETDAGVDNDRIVTPAKLAGLNITGMPWYVDDDTMVSATATTFPSSESVVAYVASQVAGTSTYKGGYNAATNVPDLDATVPAVGVEQGDMYTVTTAGTFFAVAVEVGDLLIAEVDSPTVEADWTIVQRNLDQATETVPGIAGIATQTETNTGVDDTRFVTPAKLAGYTGFTRKYAQDIGNGAATTIAVTHNLGTTDVVVSVKDNGSSDLVLIETVITSSNVVTVGPFAVAPTTGQYRVTVVG